MKKTLTAITLLAGAVCGYSQAELNFQTAETGSFVQSIYNQNVQNTAVAVTYNGYTVYENQGSTSGSATTPAQTPTGTTVYNGAGLSGSGYTALLLGATGTGDALSQLQPLLNATGNLATLSFSTAATKAGLGQGTDTTFGSATATSATPMTIAIAAWNNEGGTVTTLLAAQEADVANSDPWGISELANITATVTPTPAAAMSTASNLNLSFNLGTEVPEPSTIALGVMGVSALLFRRRK